MSAPNIVIYPNPEDPREMVAEIEGFRFYGDTEAAVYEMAVASMPIVLQHYRRLHRYDDNGTDSPVEPADDGWYHDRLGASGRFSF